MTAHCEEQDREGYEDREGYKDGKGYLCDIGLVHFPDQVSGRVKGLAFSVYFIQLK